MLVAKRSLMGLVVALSAIVSASAVAGGYGMGSYSKGGYGQGYGPGKGMPYGGPYMGMPARPQRPARPPRPERPQMWGPYRYGSKGMPMMPGTYGAPGNYGQAPGAYGAPAAPAADPQPAEATESASVSISQMRFQAPTVTIKAGGTVTWTNAEAMPHTVTADNGSFDSVQLGAGDTFSHTFAEPGTYAYYCKLHPMMRATVVVVA